MENPPSLPRTVLRDPVHWCAFGFGAGLLPWAPGTWGSLLALVAYALVPPLPLAVQLGVLAVLALAGGMLVGVSARRLGVHDHPGIVLDEVLGMWLALAFTPRSLAWWGTAFLLFRLADILKPWPIREIDHRLGGGAGIMLDDVLAAVFAALAVGGLQLLPLS